MLRTVLKGMSFWTEEEGFSEVAVTLYDYYASKAKPSTGYETSISFQIQSMKVTTPTTKAGSSRIGTGGSDSTPPPATGSLGCFVG